MVGLVASGPEVEMFVLGKMAFEGPDMRRDTIFRIASMTKPVTATVEDLLTFRCGHGLILAPPGRYPIQKAIADLGIFGPPDRALPFGR